MNLRNLILVRHGQSEWNSKNLFTGWKDPGLTELGIKEAKDAGKLIADKGILFNLMYTSCLLYTSPSPRDGLLSRMPSSA